MARLEAARTLADLGDEHAIPALEQAYREVTAMSATRPGGMLREVKDGIQGAILALRERHSQAGNGSNTQ